GDVVDAAGTSAGGDGVLPNDVTITRQMALGNIPQPTGAQFQVADSAPRLNPSGTPQLGDGCPINATDVTVTRQYNLGNFPATPAGGPTAAIPCPTPPPSLTEEEIASSPDAVGRIIRAVNTAGVAGQQVTVSFQLDSQGDESSASYTVNYNPAVLTYVSSALGTGVPTGSNLGTNVSQTGSGRLGILVDSTNTYAAGTRQMVTVTFAIAGTATAGVYPITFSSTPTPQSVSSAGGALLATTYENGNVTITVSAAGVLVAGRVLTSDGRGLRNATVTLTDSHGNRRTAITSSFGSYRFEDVEAGDTYIIAVNSRRYRFATRVVNVTDSLSDVDFVGLE
ncbi:MAG TPA: carboxypeptidase regulatory-like domain-containing protein, partial [Pyrinomonadaceae bacterium]|nr:carboxypeptidase regulatory-like domain-containing protein [Pyrinomonadaceae bacterium]